jgi:hypothetical protein
MARLIRASYDMSRAAIRARSRADVSLAARRRRDELVGPTAAAARRRQCDLQDFFCCTRRSPIGLVTIGLLIGSGRTRRSPDTGQSIPKPDVHPAPADRPKIGRHSAPAEYAMRIKTDSSRSKPNRDFIYDVQRFRQRHPVGAENIRPKSVARDGQQFLSFPTT